MLRDFIKLFSDPKYRSHPWFQSHRKKSVTGMMAFSGIVQPKSCQKTSSSRCTTSSFLMAIQVLLLRKMKIPNLFLYFLILATCSMSPTRTATVRSNSKNFYKRFRSLRTGGSRTSSNVRQLSSSLIGCKYLSYEKPPTLGAGKARVILFRTEFMR